jgi:pyruvate,water dikinase
MDEGTITAVPGWDPPGPGPWQQDSAHNPVAQTLLMQQVYPAGFNRGFVETFGAYGVLLDRLAMGTVNGFAYHQPQPFDMPGPDGPKDPEWIGAEFGRRVEVAAQAFARRIWRDAMRRWDDELKPAAIARHRELADGLDALDDEQLHARVRACLDHLQEMVYQHHRHNGHAMVPVGDFMLHAAQWTHRPPHTLMGVLDGYSPVSNVSPPEMQAALGALRADAGAREILLGDGPPADVLAALRARSPEIDDYVAGVHFRMLEGFDIANPTIGERPESLVGRLRAALDVDHDTSRQRADAFAAELRAATPQEHRAEFDDLLAEARLVYRLRDERGIYSDIAAIGLVRLVLLELGRRLEARGRVKVPDDVLEAGLDEIDALFAGADAPTAHELHQRGIDRLDRTLAGAPRFLGDPPHPPPPVEMLPPPLARVMGAIGFMIDGVLGQLEQPAGDGTSIAGIPGAAGVYEGNARLVRSVDELFDLEHGDVLVAPTTGEAFNSMLHVVGAIVTDHGSFASHAAIVSREMGIPAVVGTADGTSRIRTGMRIRVDGTSGQVTILE